jgi:dimethylglycine dehydrogenase
MRSAWIDLAGVRVLALRVSFTGDLGWELHCATGDQAQLYTALIEAGREMGIGPVGSRALMSLRIEKGYGSWGREYSPEYWPQEVGLDRLIKLDKDFLNKDAVVQVMANAPRESLVLLHLDSDGTDASNADATGGEPIFVGHKGVGRVTSGAYGYAAGMSLALGYVTGVAPGARVDVMVLGRAHKATILDAPPFDADGTRLRG